MPHKECPFVALLANEVVTTGESRTMPPPITKPPQFGPHLEEPLLYPQGTEPYNFGENID